MESGCEGGGGVSVCRGVQHAIRAMPNVLFAYMSVLGSVWALYHAQPPVFQAESEVTVFMQFEILYIVCETYGKTGKGCVSCGLLLSRTSHSTTQP